MATVHLARQLDLDRLVALKRLDGLADEDDVRVRRFVREARLAASLSHPNIVTVHDAFEVDGVPYIAMEFVPGGTLRELLIGLSLEQIAGVLDGVLDGLAHAERRHIVHRDLKPENLMVTAEGGIKIADFGIAKATSAAQGDDGPLTTAGVAIGTPAYMAPEQALAEEAGPADRSLRGRRDRVRAAHRARPLRGPRLADAGPHAARQRAAPGGRRAAAPRRSGALGVGRGAARQGAGGPPRRRRRRAGRLEDIVLRLRGGRWRREAPLPFLAGAARRPRPPRSRARRARSPDDRTRAARRTPPRRRSATTPAPRASPRRARRVPRAVTLALVAGVAAAAIAAGANGVGGGRARAEPPGRAGVPGGAGGVAGRRAPPAAVGEPRPRRPSRAAAPAAGAPIDPSRVVDAERQSRRFAEEAQDTEGDGDEALTQQLRDTQYAYRDAAAAAAAGDAGRFTTTLAKADALARAALARLDGDDDDESDGDSGDDGGDETTTTSDDEGGDDENADDGGDEGGG